MKITDALLGEHGQLHQVLEVIEGRIANGVSREEAHTLARMLEATWSSHARVEDGTLYPALEAALGPESPIRLMRTEHHEIEGLIRGAEQAPDGRSGGDRLGLAMDKIRGHLTKEEDVVFPLAGARLDQAELVALGRAWAEAREIHLVSGE